ncbi:MAG TPA: hypothetical protein VK400_19595, partial [Pyrinomonadaceae bacterium]|nr:hypothetical protein [Pyrinomonadaceae bacterium]
QHTDEDAGYLPGAGWSLTGGTDYKQLAQNKIFHALHEEALPGVGSDLLWSNAKMSKSGFVFGRYLHHLQDTFSHEGFTNSTWGHTPVSWLLGGKFGTHATDKASTDKFKTLRMAKYTFAAMVRFANEIKCGCTPKGWGAGIEYDVWRFSMVDVGFPYNQLADIEGDIAAGVKNSYLASPLALQQKANILNIEMRVK